MLEFLSSQRCNEFVERRVAELIEPYVAHKQLQDLKNWEQSKAEDWQIVVSQWEKAKPIVSKYRKEKDYFDKERDREWRKYIRKYQECNLREADRLLIRRLPFFGALLLPDKSTEQASTSTARRQLLTALRQHYYVSYRLGNY